MRLKAVLKLSGTFGAVEARCKNGDGTAKTSDDCATLQTCGGTKAPMLEEVFLFNLVFCSLSSKMQVDFHSRLVARAMEADFTVRLRE